MFGMNEMFGMNFQVCRGNIFLTTFKWVNQVKMEGERFRETGKRIIKKYIKPEIDKVADPG